MVNQSQGSEYHGGSLLTISFYKACPTLLSLDSVVVRCNGIIAYLPERDPEE